MGHVMKGKSVRNANGKKITISVFVSLFILVIGGLVGSYLINREVLPLDSSGVVAVLTMLVASFAGALLSMRTGDKGGLISCVVFAVALVLVVMIAGMLFFNGLSTGLIWQIVSIAAGCVLSILTGLITKGKRPYSRKWHG